MAADQAGEDFTEELRRRPAALFLLDAEILALFSLDDFEVVDRHALAAGKALRRLAWGAVSAEGDRLGRTHRPDKEVRLFLGEVAHHQHQSARRGQGLDGGKFEAGALQFLADERFEVGHGLGEEAGGNLFAADL